MNGGSKRLLSFLICFGVSLALVLTGIIDAKQAAMVPLFLYLDCFESIGDSLVASLNNAGLIEGLFIILVGLVLIVIGLVVLILVLPLFFLEWLAKNGGGWAVTEQVIYAGMLSLTFRLIVFPILVLLIRPLLPGIAIALNDLFIAIPAESAAKLVAGQTVVVRVRSGLDLLIALLAGLMAILSFFGKG